MRITKSYLRETRTELEQSVRSAFSYTDDDLRDRLKAMWPLLVAVAHIERYIPVGTQVTVQQSGQRAINYCTQKEVIVGESTYDPSPMVADDKGVMIRPMTRTASGVWLRDQRTTIQGLTVWFAPRSLRQRIVVPKEDVSAEDIYTHTLIKVDYDIPTALGQAYALQIAGEFHKWSVKCSKSTWILRKGDIDMNLIARMEEDGCVINCDTIDRSENKKLIARAIIALQEQVETYVRGANETLQSEVDRMTNAPEDHTEEEITDRMLRQAKALEKRLEKYKSTIMPGAAKLGITPTAWSPDRLDAAARVTAQDMRARARAYRRGTAVLAAAPAGTTLAALATDAAASTLPVEVMIDAIRESGDDKLADEMTHTFSLLDGDTNE
ncbi:unnamed protein product [Sphagnum balticum]